LALQSILVAGESAPESELAERLCPGDMEVLDAFQLVSGRPLGVWSHVSFIEGSTADEPRVAIPSLEAVRSMGGRCLLP
jgi:hypothetical protein